MKNKIIKIKNTKDYIINLKNNINIYNICKKTILETYKGDL